MWRPLGCLARVASAGNWGSSRVARRAAQLVRYAASGASLDERPRDQGVLVPNAERSKLMRPPRLLSLMMGFVLTMLLLVACGGTQTTPLVPKSGSWIGRGGPFLIMFGVSEDGRQVEGVLVVYMPTPEAGKHTGSVAAGAHDIEDNSFSFTGMVGLKTVEFKGRFVSPTSVKGTFEVSGVEGEWTAEPASE